MKKYISCEIVNQFRTYLEEEERSAATIEKYLRDIRKFNCFCGTGTEISKALVISYKNWLHDYYEISSVNSMLVALNQLFRFLGWTELIIKPFKQQQQSFRSSDKELSRDEYVRLTQIAQRKGQTWLYLIMVTMCATGIRVSELPFITVESLSTRQAIVRNKGKTRRVILPLDLCRKLRIFTKERKITHGSIFVTKTGRPIDRSNIHHAMKKLCAEAGVEAGKVFPHNLRHLFAVEHYEKHHDLGGLASILGHSNINTTRIYTMVSIERKAVEVDALGLVV